MTDLVVFGAGGFGREVCELVVAINAAGGRHALLGLLDDDAALHGGAVGGWPVLGGAAWLAHRPGVQVVVALGSPACRQRVVGCLGPRAAAGYATLVDPRAVLGRRVAIGSGSIVCANVCITTDVEIGAHAILNLGATVGHDARIGAFATVAPGVAISGGCTVGEGAELGTHATLIPATTVGRWSVVGAGAVVTALVPDNATAVGVPARTIKTRPAGWQQAR